MAQIGMIGIISEHEGTIKQWKRSDSGRNRTVKNSEKVVAIAVVGPDGNEFEENILSPCSGKLMKIHRQLGERIRIGDLVAEVEPCRHPALFNSMCVSCGDTVTSVKQSLPVSGAPNSPSLSSGQQFRAGSVPLTMASGKQLQLSSAEAERLQYAKKTALQESRKLALVLDLDHTLLHAAPSPVVPPSRCLQLLGLHILTIQDNSLDPLPSGIGQVLPRHLLIKLRPGIFEFLEEANQLYQLFIYTAGTRKYAEGIAELLDPSGKYFQRRIVSRSDSPNDPSGGLAKSLRKILPGDSSHMAVILDDREDVWRGQGHQLLLVKPFEFFQGTNEVNNSSGPKSSMAAPSIQFVHDTPIVSLLQSGQTKRLDHAALVNFRDGTMRLPLGIQCSTNAILDDQLQRSLVSLRDIHSRYYSCSEIPSTAPTNGSLFKATVGDILSSIKSSVLRGCRISFSGIIPNSEVHPEYCPWWAVAASLGAELSLEVDSKTTHLISLTMTPQAAECVERGNVWIVHPDWLWYCRWALCRCLESTFMAVAWPNDKPYPNPQLGNTGANGTSKREASRDESSGRIARKKIRIESSRVPEPSTPSSNSDNVDDSFNGLAQLRQESGDFSPPGFVDLDADDSLEVATVPSIVELGTTDDTGNEVILLPTLSSGSLSDSSYSDDDCDETSVVCDERSVDCDDNEESKDDDDSDEILSVDEIEEGHNQDSDSEWKHGDHESIGDDTESDDSFSHFDEALLSR